MSCSQKLFHWVVVALVTSSAYLYTTARATRVLNSSRPVEYGVDYTTKLFGLDVVPLRNGVAITANLTMQQLELSYSAQCSAINSPMGQSLAMADISNMTMAVTSLKQTFTAVGTQLSTIDSLGLTTQKFSPSWSTLTQMWRQIVLGSVTTAEATAAYCTDLVENVMPDVINLSVADATTRLNGFISDAQSLRTNAATTAQKINDFQQTLATFTFGFQQFVIAQNAAIDANITILSSDIQKVNASVQAIDMEIAAIGAELGSIVLSSAASAKRHPFWAPFILAAALVEEAIVGIPLVSLSNENQKDLAQIAADEASINLLEGKDAMLARANETITDLRELTLSASSLMGSINVIWNTAASEAEDVITFLNMAEAFLEPQIFWGEVNKVPCYYEALNSTMIQYAQGVLAAQP